MEVGFCRSTREVVLDRFLARLVNTHVGTFTQLVDIFTKGLIITLYDLVSYKLGLFDLYACSRGSVNLSLSGIHVIPLSISLSHARCSLCYEDKPPLC